MPMDFFARQDHARRRTGWLIFLFCIAVLATISMVYVAVQATWFFLWADNDLGGADAFIWWRPTVFLIVSLCTFLIVVVGSLGKISQLSAEGGEGVALRLGGKEVLPTTTEFFERRLRNVVEEMSIASGTPVPRVFVLESERGINAFAAGFQMSEAVVAVSKATNETLTRNELQGVVAHEFSHILNGDMALNIRLMGVLHGLMAIAVTGRVILEVVGDSSSRRIRARSEKGDIRGVALVFGFSLLVIGSIGLFFCRMIKASVSRSRERLADASAVQFTRNPEGLANALIKIGRLDTGSRIRHPKAEEISHLFFAKGLRLTGFATHPPLLERIQWLDPSFDGIFQRASLEELRAEVGLVEEVPAESLTDKKPDVVDLFTNPQQLAVAAAILQEDSTDPSSQVFSNPSTLLEHVGKPMSGHVERAKELLASIPHDLRHHLEDSYGARVVIYWMLLHVDEDKRSLQLDLLATRLETQVLDALNQARPALEVLTPELCLPILDLALPVLRTLSKDQYGEFRTLVDELILLDKKVNVHEFALRKLLHHHLDPEFGLAPRKQYVKFYALRGVPYETSVVLSAFAQHGHSDPGLARAAFDAAVASLGTTKGEYAWVEREEISWRVLDEAVGVLQTTSFGVKRWFLGASLLCMTHDEQMTVKEVELFRVIADVLGCPVPPWVAPLER